MDIFDVAKNDNFFSPLVSKNKKIFYDCILLLIDEQRRHPYLYDSDVRKLIDRYLSNSQVEYVPEEDEENEKLPPAAMIVQRYRACGWMSEKELRGHSYVTSITSSALHIIGALKKLADRRGRGHMLNHILSMHSLLKESVENEEYEARVQPYTSIVLQISEHIEGLQNELVDMRDSVNEIMQASLDLNSLKEMGHFLSRNEVRQKFFSEYFYIKNQGTVNLKMKQIIQYIRTLKNDMDLRQKTLEEMMETENIDASSADDLLAQTIEEQISFLRTDYSILMDEIDERINTQYGILNARMNLLYAGGQDREARLDQLLSRTKMMSERESDVFWKEVSEAADVSVHQYVGVSSFNRRIYTGRNTEAKPLPVTKADPQELMRQTKELLEKHTSRYSVKRVTAYFEAKPFINNRLDISHDEIHDREDVMMYIAAIIYSSSASFPYKAFYEEGTVETEIADLPHIVLEKKGKKQ